MYLIHGTFVGDDPSGVLAELSRYMPGVRDAPAARIHKLAETALNDRGFYTEDFAADFAAALEAEGEPPIEVRRFTWSGENHHLGRADAAVRLIDALAAVELPPGRRILVWAHSHAGNVLALVSQLLAGADAAPAAFFEAARPFYRVPLLGRYDLPHWRRMEERLHGGPHPVLKHPLDVVTFGTPIRYGWNLGEAGRLLHVVQHRPLDDAQPDRAVLPRSFDDLQGAVGGDYIQQLGIAGTDLPPAPWFWRAWWADRRLSALLQPADLSIADLFDRLCRGRRVPDAGRTLLVDYGPLDGGTAEHFAGHAVYTRREWLPFHVSATARWLYDC